MAKGDSMKTVNVIMDIEVIEQGENVQIEGVPYIVSRLHPVEQNSDGVKSRQIDAIGPNGTETSFLLRHTSVAPMLLDTRRSHRVTLGDWIVSVEEANGGDILITASNTATGQFNSVTFGKVHRG
jgi:hypothetical protein